MIIRHIKLILLLTGLITLSPGIVFFWPEQIAPLLHIEVTGEAGLHFARHWGLEVACIGGLLLTAAFNAAVRVPVLIAAIVGKGGLVYLLLMQSGNPVFSGMSSTIIFDGLCVVLYLIYLLQSRHQKSA